MRGLRRAVLPSAILAACGGGDLTLPGSSEPAVLSIVSGDGQRGTVGEAVADPLVVQVADAGGHPVPGATVLFLFGDDSTDARLDPSSSATDDQGLAWASVQLGSLPGAQTVDAKVAKPGTDLEVHFRLTAVEKAPRGDGGGGGAGGGGGGGGETGGDEGGGGKGNGGGGKGKGHGHG